MRHFLVVIGVLGALLLGSAASALADGPSGEQIVELCNHVQKTSPLSDIIRNPVAVTVTLED